MRVWDLPPELLCPRHLLAEHFEIHTIWSVLTRGLKGWAHHPETLRWRGRLRALYLRHEADAAEMTRRGYHHKSPLDEALATGEAGQAEFVDAPEEQVRLLRERCEGCRANLTEAVPNER
jgi:hypothetical protein